MQDKKLPRKHNKNLTSVAKMLRKNMTSEEKRLWYDFLNTYPIKFTRQKVLGRYIVDFYCAKVKLVIELDGSGHDTIKGQAYDWQRTEFLKEYDIRVLRIPNVEINQNFDHICEYIDYCIKQLAKLDE